MKDNIINENKKPKSKSFSDSNICRNEVANQETKIEKPSFVGDQKENLRTIMQALHGCRKNCRECKDEEVEYYPETKIMQKSCLKN